MSTVYEVNSQAEVVLPLLSDLLKLADDYRRDGSPHQAIELYFELAEQNDMPHEARSIYERLLVEQTPTDEQ
jgi:hypothetical protein